MISVKGAGGGGKKEGLNVWKKHLKVNVTQTGLTSSPKFLISSDDIDVTTLTAEDFVGFVMVNELGATITFLSATTSVYAYAGTTTKESTWSYDPATATMLVNGTGNFATLRTWEFTETLKFDYVVSDDPTAYPNGAIHTDGYYYEKGENGLYVWKKHKYVVINDITLSFTQTVANPTTFVVSSNDIDLSTVNGEFFAGVTITNTAALTVTFSFKTNGAIDVNGKSGTYTYNQITHEITTSYNMSGLGIQTWKSYTVEGSEDKIFLDYVVSDNPTAYPDGAEQDGYWYERVKERTKYGMFFNKVDPNCLPTDAYFKFENVPEHAFHLGGDDYATFMGSCKKLEIDANDVGREAFYYYLANMIGGKLKLKVKSLDIKSFSGMGNNNIWLSSKCTTITATSWSNCPFYDSVAGSNVYCEASSKPSGWGTYWNTYGSSKNFTTTWGVTEAQFDAL